MPQEEVPPAEAPSLLKRLVPSFSALLFVLFVVSGLAMIATPKFVAAGARAEARACYADQKTVEGALEMYALDHGVMLKDLATLGETLRAGGYLQSVPRHQGQAPLETIRVVEDPQACRAHRPNPVAGCEACAEALPLRLVCEDHGWYGAPPR